MDECADQPLSHMTAADRLIPSIQYEYLDHPADVQLHAWGESLQVAFEQVTMAMFGYMTDIQTVEIETQLDVEVDGLDMNSLLYQFMDEFLFNFCAEPNFIPRVSRLNHNSHLRSHLFLYSQKIKIIDFDKSNFRIRARGFGQTFNLKKHPQVSGLMISLNAK